EGSWQMNLVEKQFSLRLETSKKPSIITNRILNPGRAFSALLLGVSLVWLGAGCGSVPPLQTQNLQQLEINGLRLTVYPLTTKAEVKHVFKVNLLARGVLPIKLSAENSNPSNSFVIAKDKILIMNETTR